MCRFFSVSRSEYYAYLQRKDIPDKDLQFAEKIRECQESNHNTYGYRRVIYGRKDRKYTEIPRQY